MQHQDREHLLAIVEPTHSDATSVDVARDLVARGGRATVLVLITDRTRADFRRFADSENLDAGAAEAIAIDRITDEYVSRVGGDDTETIVTHVQGSARELLSLAAAARPTSIVIPAQLTGRAGVRRLVSGSDVPVLVMPAA